MVGCIKFNPELRYTQEQLAEHLPEIEGENEPTAVQINAQRNKTAEFGNQCGLYHVGCRCEFLKFCHRNAKLLSEPLWYAQITVLAPFKGGEEKIHKLSKSHPNYTYEETQKKIEHFRKTGTNPMTCKAIAEKGFKCPKLGKCKVKSPAGLAFIPLTVDELKKLLLKIEKVGEMADNTLLAEQFISDYLFNVSPSVAEAFINHNISKHFDFKGSDKRPLLLHYREISKAYTHHYENEKAKSELPLWYRRNKLGDLHLMSGVLAEWLYKEIYAIYCTEQYYFYENGVYKPRTEKDAKAIVQTRLFPSESTMNQINDAEGQWQLRIRTESNEINPNPYLINCKNGLYNVMDNTFGDHNPKILSTVQMKASYIPDSKCDLWLKFLHSVLNEPEINLMQEIFGYLLVPITSAQKSFILCGKANTGKSTILRAMQELLLGADNVSSIPLQNLSERFQVAELFGKMANIFADLPDKSITDVGMFKAVTGEDFISADRKYKDTINFKPFARFFMSCNSMARNYGDRSEAFYRRLIIISFSKLVPEEKKDPQLLDKLRKEADGILWWAIQGLKRLIANNYRFSETDKTKAEVQKYKLQNNNVLAFVLEHCVIEEGAVSSRRELYNAYKEFCSDNGKPTSKQNFNAWICDADPAKITLSEEAVTRARDSFNVNVIHFLCSFFFCHCCNINNDNCNIAATSEPFIHAVCNVSNVNSDPFHDIRRFTKVKRINYNKRYRGITLFVQFDVATIL
jgi:putative DNA primase/helicase